MREREQDERREAVHPYLLSVCFYHRASEKMPAMERARWEGDKLRGGWGGTPWEREKES